MKTIRSGRAELMEVELSHMPGEQCKATVTLGRRLARGIDETYVGDAEGHWSPIGELRCSAAAALKALEQSFGCTEGTFSVLDLKTVESFDGPGVLVAVSARHTNVPQRLVGFCEVTEDPKAAAAKAALNGTNRYVWYHFEAGG
ncbi:MAG: hypothetical protein JSW71_17340 [Gemmatimonadota bacterium]|nr:MAG: hypothetical protein JSW71_17340 [Gemmatimonadota bacterium]